MKQTVRLFLVALFAGAVTLGGYKYLEKKNLLLLPLNKTQILYPLVFLRRVLK